jgi:hypothetical protein
VRPFRAFIFGVLPGIAVNAGLMHFAGFSGLVAAPIGTAVTLFIVMLVL